MINYMITVKKFNLKYQQKYNENSGDRILKFGNRNLYVRGIKILMKLLSFNSVNFNDMQISLLICLQSYVYWNIWSQTIVQWKPF